MTAKHRIIWLTVLQMMMVIVGFCTFLVIKQYYQRFVIISSFREALKDEISGKEKLRATSPRIMLPWLALPLVLVVGRNSASIFYRAGRKKRQIKRDIKAVLLLDRLQQGYEEPFSLYLRSFSQEEKLKRRKGFWWYILIEGDIFGIDRETLDLMISSEVRDSYPMIALGRPGEKLGAGRLPSTDTDWQALILLLMERAKVIFMVPSISKGVIWEMEILSRHYYEKTIYIMPPPKYYYGAAESVEEYWLEAQREFIPSGIFLPLYIKQGALFMLDEQGRVDRSSLFDIRFGGSNMCDFIRQIE